MKHLMLLVCISLLCSPLLEMGDGVLTETSTQQQTQQRQHKGQLVGYVVADAGQPLANAQVTITRVGSKSPLLNRTTATDERGQFQFSNIEDGGYTVSAHAPGYTRADDSSKRQHYRPGDSVVLTMLKGGVITGSVTSQMGDALVNVPVRAFRIMDAEEKAVGVSESFAFRLTDDRGIYRFYGLAPGAYLVYAGGGFRSYTNFNKYEHEAPTFYPSSIRQTAEKVMVQLGQEVSGINITYRGGEGHRVSGTVVGRDASRIGPSVAVALADWSTGEIRDIGHTMQEGSFAFYGVPDGEYYLIAQYFPGDEKERLVSRPYRIKVVGADMADVKLSLSPLGAVSGRVELEHLPKDSSQRCGQKQRAVVEEALVSLQRERIKGEPERLWDTLNAHGAPDEKGLFNIYGVGAGQYRINAALPGETWFTKSVAVVREPVGGQKGITSSGQADSMVNSISVQPKTQLRMAITLAEGAARLSGRISASNEKSLYIGISVHLVPAEPINYENALRYFQTEAQNDGVFSFSNIAPGKYWIFVQASADKPDDNSPSEPSSWNATGRAILRKAAQKSNVVVELDSCQSAQNYAVRYKPGN